MGRRSSASVDHLSTAHCLKDFQLCPQAFQLVNSGRAHIDEDSWQNVKRRSAKCRPRKSLLFTQTREVTVHYPHPKWQSATATSGKECSFTRRLFPNYIFIVITSPWVTGIAHVLAEHVAKQLLHVDGLFNSAEQLISVDEWFDLNFNLFVVDQQISRLFLKLLMMITIKFNEYCSSLYKLLFIWMIFQNFLLKLSKSSTVFENILWKCNFHTVFYFLWQFPWHKVLKIVSEFEYKVILYRIRSVEES